MASLAVLIVLLNFVTIGLLGGDHLIIEAKRGKWIMYWLAIPVFWGWFLHFGIQWPSRSRTRFAIIVMVLDVTAITCPYAKTKAVADTYPRSPIIDYIRENNPDGYRVYDLWDDPFNRRVFLLGPGSPGASVYGVPSAVGYNPLDVARYRRFLAFLADIGEPQAAFAGDFTHPVVIGFWLYNYRLSELLGMRFLWMREDAVPSEEMLATRKLATVILGVTISWSGVQELRTNTWHREDVLAVYLRRFAHRAASPGAQRPRTTQIDRRSHAPPRSKTGTPNDSTTAIQLSVRPREDQITKPNEIRIALDSHTAGLLVLTDPWYPGWVCRVDGNEVPIWKADYAFRGVMVPEGSREVVFHFEPQIVSTGKWISLATSRW